MMRILFSTIFIAFLISKCTGNEKVSFIMDFFSNKPVKINLFACWKQENYKQLIRDVNKSRKPKQIGTFTLDTLRDENLKDLIAHNSYFVWDENCQFSWSLLDQIGKTDKFKYPMHLLIITNESRKSALYNKLAHYQIYYNSDVTVATFKNGVYNLEKIYKITTNSEVEFVRIGSWSKQGFKLLTNSEKCNFKALKFDVALVLEDLQSLQHLEDFRFPWVDVYTKQNYGTLTRLFDYCNITYRFERVPNYKHVFESNQTFLFTGSSPYLTKDLLTKMDAMYLQNAPKICFMMKRPPTSYVTTIFTDAFSPSVWYAMLTTLALLSIALFAFLNIEGRRQKIKFQEKFTVFDLGLIALEAVCQQGTSTDPKSYSARILEVIMFTAFMFLYVSYSANILVLLQSTTEIKYDELYRFRFKYGGMNTTVFQQYHSDTGSKIFRDGINIKDTYAITRGMELVKEGLFAFFSESPYVYNYAKDFFTDYEICGLQEVGGYYEKNLGYISIVKNSPYQEILKVSLLRMIEFGFQSRHYTRYFLKPQCFLKGSSFDPVGIAETYQVKILVVLGMILSFVILILELTVWKMQNRNNQ